VNKRHFIKGVLGDPAVLFYCVYESFMELKWIFIILGIPLALGSTIESYTHKMVALFVVCSLLCVLLSLICIIYSFFALGSAEDFYSKSSRGKAKLIINTLSGYW
jgi:hypothetical protein